MAELLVKAVDAVHADAEKDRRGSHKKGDIIVVKDDGHEWGAAEGLPTFVVVKCPGLSTTLVEDKLAPWVWSVNFNVTASNLPLDGHRIVMTNATQNPSGGASLTLARTTAFLTSWAATLFASTSSSVTFDVTIGACILSPGFWGQPLTNLSLVEQSYVQAGGGVHTMIMDYTGHPRWTDAPDPASYPGLSAPAALIASRAQFSSQIANQIGGVGATLLSNTAGVATFTLLRANVRERFRADVTSKLGTYQRHRYHFTEAQVDSVIAGGGTITVTAPQLAAAVQDRQAA